MSVPFDEGTVQGHVLTRSPRMGLEAQLLVHTYIH
jgi:hypothetical protein